jgi:hypothetical protein
MRIWLYVIAGGAFTAEGYTAFGGADKFQEILYFRSQGYFRFYSLHGLFEIYPLVKEDFKGRFQGPDLFPVKTGPF